MTKVAQSEVIWRALEEAAAEMPDKVGYICQGVSITFREMDEISDRVASGFLRQGVRKGDRIGIIGLNQLEWLYAFFAAATAALADSSFPF